MIRERKPFNRNLVHCLVDTFLPSANTGGLKPHNIQQPRRGPLLLRAGPLYGTSPLGGTGPLDGASSLGRTSSCSSASSCSRTSRCGSLTALDHDEVNARLVRLLRVGPEPEPLQDALARLGALARGEVGGHGDAEGGVVGRQRGEVLVGVDVAHAVEGDERVPDDSVGGRVDDARVHRSTVRDRQDRLHVDDLARRELLDLVRVVLELCAPAEAEVA